MPVDPTLLLGFLGLSALLSAVPGPSVLLETSRAVTHGRRSAMWIVLGNACGGIVLLALVVSGLGAVVTTSARAFVVMKVVGACYLLWLGVRAIVSARTAPAAATHDLAPDVGSRRTLVRRGFLVGVGNPKSVVSLMAVLPQFVDHERGHVVVQMLLIGLAGGLAQVLIETVWVQAADALRGWFRRRPRRIRALRTAGGVAMVGLAGRLALER